MISQIPEIGGLEEMEMEWKSPDEFLEFGGCFGWKLEDLI